MIAVSTPHGEGLCRPHRSPYWVSTLCFLAVVLSITPDVLSVNLFLRLFPILYLNPLVPLAPDAIKRAPSDLCIVL